MKKIDLGQTIAILANVGVIAGIFFLGIEIQQNTRSQHAATYQALMEGIADLNQQTLTHPRLRQILRGQHGQSLEDLNQDDYDQGLSFTHSVLRYGDMAYFHYQSGLIDRERLRGVLGPLNGYACEPVFRQYWDRIKPAYMDTYRDEVDRLMDAC